MTSRLPVEQVVGVYRRNLGAMRLATIHDGMLSAAFADIVGREPEQSEALHRAAHRSLPPQLSCNTFVIEHGDRLLMVDAGCGNTAPAAGQNLRGLAALGIAPDAVDTILMTHLHRDHAAGLIDPAGRALFPHAELIVHEDDLAFWRDERSLARLRPSQQQDFFIATAVLAAYRDRLKPVTGGEVLPGISSVPVPGHTPGHTAWLLESESEHRLIWGDVVHFPAVQFPFPQASVAYDLDSAAAAVSRRRILDRAAADRLSVAGVHLDFPCFGFVERAANGGFTYTAETWTSTIES